MIFGIRDAKLDDLVHLKDCDLKCFDYAWNDEEWEHVFGHYAIKVAHYYGTPIAFAAFVLSDHDPILRLLKVGVQKPYRRRKVGRLLVEEVRRIARMQGAGVIESTVPESMCRPNETQDISGWLMKIGFTGKGVVRNYVTNMGADEDGFLFRMKV